MFKIKQKEIGLNKPTYFIADIAANHDGDLNRAKKLILLAAESGADAAKFQHFDAKTIVSDYGFKDLASSKSHQKNWKKSVFDVYQDASINLGWTKILKDTCDEAGIAFFTSPYSLELVDIVDPYVPAYKIGSGDITWIEIIEKIASKNKPYILATGASNMNEVDIAVNAALKINTNFALMQCNTNYTASLENFKYINLNVIQEYKKKFPNIILGLSDHTPGFTTVLGSISLGARIIEKHFTDDCSRSGPDHAFSMDSKSWLEMVQRSRELENALGDFKKKVELNEIETVILQRRSIRLSKNLNEGDTITKNDISYLRPCPEDGISPYESEKIIGKKINNSMKSGQHIKWTDLK